MGQPTTGAKKVLASRILDNLVELPAEHVKLLPETRANAKEDGPDPDIIDDEEAVDPARAAMQQLVQDLGLSQRTLEIFRAEEFFKVDDLRLMTPEDLNNMDITKRDRFAIRKFFEQPRPAQNPVLLINQQEQNKRHIPLDQPPMFNIPRATITSA